MNKISLEFIDSIIESEFQCYEAGLEESILHNKYLRNLFLVFPNREQVKNYLIECCEKNIRI